MKTPLFWTNKNLLSTLLLPLGWLYGAATNIKIKMSRAYNASKPVICIGNLTAGGTGKTPVSLAMAELFKEMGKNPFFISRGYGGKLKNVIVNPSIHLPNECGDEPLLLSLIAPTVVNPNRGEAARLALQNGADVLIMDDGFQNGSLEKDISFLVFDGRHGIGNQRLIPAGPLRESLYNGLKRAHAVIILGDDQYGIKALIENTDRELKLKRDDKSPRRIPVFKANITPVKPHTNDKPVLAFAGIGYPEKFYNSLRECGLNVVWRQNFADHHFYKRSELETLIRLASKNDWDIYTTMKDYVKIPADMQKYFKVLNVKIHWENKKKLKSFLEESLKKFL